MTAAFEHASVLVEEVIAGLAVRPDGIYVDGTAGGGGHAAAIARGLTTGRLIALDRDPEAVAAARARLAPYPQAVVRHAAFAELPSVLAAEGIGPGTVDGILVDLGVSSHQLDAAERGFSFRQDGPLDMRMDPGGGPSAADLIASTSEGDLARLFARNDEPHARRIAGAIVRRRAERPFERTVDLADTIAAAIPARDRARSRVHPATVAFQALRIETNGEDRQLSALLDTALDWLRPGGRLAVLSFHSGEDRPVKQRFAFWAADCVCHPAPPICACGWLPQVRLPQPKGWTAGPAELERNPRARSARLRIAERLATPRRSPPPGARR